MKYIKFVFLVVMIFSFLLVCFNDIYAQGGKGSKSDCPAGQVCLDNPLGTDVTPQIFIGKIIKAILGIVGSLALVMFIYGGFNIMTAAGSPEKVEKGKQILVWATIGLIVIFTSYALVKFVFTSLGV